MGALPNEHGVYVDDLEELEFTGRGIRVSISIAECDDGFWRWGYDLLLRGSPWIACGCGCGPSVRDAGCVDRRTAMKEAADFLLVRMSQTEKFHEVSDTPARRDLERWLESIGCLGGQLVLF